ncbi:Rhizoctonia solani AG1-IB WGS project CAOJ00000000 data, isolate 7/3/14, contig 16258, related, partial [Eimeria tenella]
MSVIYPGGLSGAFPAAVQQQLLQSVPGLEAAVLLRLAYDVEYLVVKGSEVQQTLQTKNVEGLFVAGQVLGTTGAAAAAAAAAGAGLAAAGGWLVMLHSRSSSCCCCSFCCCSCCCQLAASLAAVAAAGLV